MNYTANIDSIEVNKFSSLANRWWELDGPCAPLHVLNPCRLQFVQQHVRLEQQSVLDIGCGAGILSESLARHGAIVTGIDASTEVIAAAKQHAASMNLEINYLSTTAEDFLANSTSRFDIITCMELLEHVPSPEQLIKDCSQLLKPGGYIFLSTLNRTFKAYGLAIIGAEYLLNILPKQTHDYKKFIRPSELANMCNNAEIRLNDLSGINYNPITKHASLCTNVDVNYIACAIKDL